MMSTNRSDKRRRQKLQGKLARRQPSSPRQTGRRALAAVPSAQTMWRTMHLNFGVQDTLAETTMDLLPGLWKRDHAKIQRVEQAPDLESVLDLAPAATGLADYAWLKRMRGFGPDAADRIVARLQSDWMHRHAKQGAGIQERLLGALRWCDGRAPGALTDCWDALDDYGRSLASIALGLLGEASAADRLWAFFQRMRPLPKSYFVGPLWGLIDVGDRRAADALVELVADQRQYYEQYGFLSRTGDHRVALPLIAEALEGTDERRSEAMWALTGIAYRIGRDDFGAAIRNGEDAQPTESSGITSFLDLVFRYSQDDVERHFERFYDRNATSLLTQAKKPAPHH
jgi:hypothetical protein